MYANELQKFQFIEAIKTLIERYKSGSTGGHCPLCRVAVSYDILNLEFDYCVICPWMIFEGHSCEIDEDERIEHPTWKGYDNENLSERIERLERWLEQME